MEESKRQKQVAKVIQAELNEIFRHTGLPITKNGMISISDVKVTPDLLEARIYLSLFQIENENEIFAEIKEREKEWRGLLGNKMKNQLRRIPVLVFHKDDTLDHVFKMEELFKQLEEDRKK